jgi:hypothetical protein
MGDRLRIRASCAPPVSRDPHAKDAQRAIVEREISDPLTQSRLAAQRVKEIG